MKRLRLIYEQLDEAKTYLLRGLKSPDSSK